LGPGALGNDFHWTDIEILQALFNLAAVSGGDDHRRHAMVFGQNDLEAIRKRVLLEGERRQRSWGVLAASPSGIRLAVARDCGYNRDQQAQKEGSKFVHGGVLLFASWLF
jgi:hypothetical protein